MKSRVTEFEVERRKKCMSRWDLAHMTGIYPSRITSIERGEAKPRDGELALISGALGLPVRKVKALIYAGEIK